MIKNTVNDIKVVNSPKWKQICRGIGLSFILGTTTGILYSYKKNRNIISKIRNKCVVIGTSYFVLTSLLN